MAGGTPSPTERVKRKIVRKHDANCITASMVISAHGFMMNGENANVGELVSLPVRR